MIGLWNKGDEDHMLNEADEEVWYSKNINGIWS